MRARCLRRNAETQANSIRNGVVTRFPNDFCCQFHFSTSAKCFANQYIWYHSVKCENSKWARKMTCTPLSYFKLYLLPSVKPNIVVLVQITHIQISTFPSVFFLDITYWSWSGYLFPSFFSNFTVELVDWSFAQFKCCQWTFSCFFFIFEFSILKKSP